MSTELMPVAHANLVPQEPLELTVEEIVGKVAKVRQVADSVMKDGVHYGTIPGTAKPTLYKAGAEILSLTFRLTPRYEGERQPIDLGNGHREYVVRCDLYHIHTGAFYGSGIGSCSTMESKYRFRPGPKESTGRPVPKEYWDHRKTDPQKASEMLGGKGYATGKDENGQWVIMRQGETVENPNIADTYNTVLKIAGKRAYVDAILKATAASEVYTQDLEDIVENESVHGGNGRKAPVQTPQRKAEAATPPPPAAPSDEPPFPDDYATAQPEDAPPPAEPSGDVISDKQRKRLYAIARGSGFADAQFEADLRSMGYASSKDVTRDAYDQVVAHFQR